MQKENKNTELKILFYQSCNIISAKTPFPLLAQILQPTLQRQQCVF